MFSEMPVVLEAQDLSKTYLLYARPRDRLKQFLWRGRKIFFREKLALRGVSFQIYKGQTVGIVGRNGSGKSTLLQLLAGILTPTSGTLAARGRISALLELGSGFNPEFTGRENVFLSGAILGLKRATIEAKFDDIAAFAAIGDYIDQPVKTYSSGMAVRLAFAVAAVTDPDILIVDEALAVGDEAFQRKCFARLEQLKQRGCTILFVSHASRMVTELCDRALLIDDGELLMDGVPKTVVAWYHRLIYADTAEQAAIRGMIRAEEAAPPPTGEQKAPESRLEYTSAGARIRNPRLLDAAGHETAILARGQRYGFAYDVAFEREAREVRFGMLIKTKTGLELGGDASARKGETLPVVKAGSVVRVHFTFDCLLLPGVYFLNCGTSAVENGARVFLHRIIDACMFRVLPEPEQTMGGLVDFRVACSVELAEG